MFARLLVGLDGSPPADVALEQAIVLTRRFGGTIVVACAREAGQPWDPGLLERARFRVAAAGLPVEAIERHQPADAALTELAANVGAVLVGRRGTGAEGALGTTAAALVRTASRCVVVCGGSPSPMRRCAVAFDGRETSGRALELAARFVEAGDGALHVVYAGSDPGATPRVLGLAEAALSLRDVAYHTHVRAGPPGVAVAALVREIRADALFAGAHVEERAGRPRPVLVSHAEEILKQTSIPVVVQP